MAGDLSTRLDQPYARQPQTRADAARYLRRKSYADLLPMLGLADEPERDRGVCRKCSRPLSLDGRCRRRSCYPGLPGKQGESAAAGGDAE